MSRVVGPDKAGGLEVYAGFQAGSSRTGNDKIRMKMEINNIASPGEIKALAIQLNKNSFGLSPVSQQLVCNPPIRPGQSGATFVELVTTPAMLAPPPPAGQPPVNPQIQVAIKNMQSGTVFYFAVNMNLDALFAPDSGPMERSTFIEAWKSIDDKNEMYSTITSLPSDSCDIESVTEKFSTNNIHFIARRPGPNNNNDGLQEVVYYSMRTITGMDFLAELTFKKGVNACKLCLKTDNAAYTPLCKQALERILKE